MARKKKDSDVEKLDFEQAITSLTEVVEDIERGDITLGESIEKYERGMALIRRCRQILQAAEKRIEKISAESEAAGREAPPAAREDGMESERTDGAAERNEGEEEGEEEDAGGGLF